MWNIDGVHADSVDIHKTEGSYISTFHFNTIGEWAFTKISFFSSQGVNLQGAQMAHDIYMSNLTLKSTQKLLLNFISTIANNETAV